MQTSVFKTYYSVLLLLIIAFAFVTRVYRLHIPEKYVFDEVYHAVTAKLISQNDQRAYEWHNPPPEPNTAVDWLHPPYAKLTQAAAINIFGATSFGWRLSSVVFGCLVVLITAQLAKALFKNEQIALLSAFLVSLDGLVLTMSRIAMNDIHVTFFILLSFWAYIEYINSARKMKRYILLSSLAAGLALGTKWSGVFAIGFIGISEAIHTLKTIFTHSTIKTTLKQNVLYVANQVGLLLLVCIVIPAVLYLGSYSHMFLLGKDITHLIEMHKNTWWYQTNLTATHPAQSQPFEWFLNIKPVWIAVEYPSTNMRADIYAIGNSLLFWIGGVSTFATLGVLLLHKFFKKKSTLLKKLAHPLLGMLLFAYCIVWLPWQLSPRIMFFYHYLPAVPLLSINLAYWLHILWQYKRIRALPVLIVVSIFAFFVVWYPHLTLIPVPVEIKNTVYFALDVWKQK